MVIYESKRQQGICTGRQERHWLLCVVLRGGVGLEWFGARPDADALACSFFPRLYSTITYGQSLLHRPFWLPSRQS